MMHIIERFFYHYPWAILMVGMIAFGLEYAERKGSDKYTRWIPPGFNHKLVYAALLVGLVMPAREWWDTWRGNQVWYKAPIDQFSWYFGAFSGLWFFYRGRLWILKHWRP